jgi:succinate-semialdehyde dehydrogenase/glutarate-semialdehyde dehydrogenase
MQRWSLYLNGEWREGELEAPLTVYNPATGEAIAEVAQAGPRRTAEAIAAAHQAFSGWAALTAEERAQYLFAIAAALRADADRLAEVLTGEQGKPLAEARAEIAISADYFQWYGEEAKRVYGEVIPASSPDKRLLTLRRPVGVSAAITPWNFPASMIARKVAPALAVGCTTIIKPASATPLSALEMARVFDQVGLPAGVANVLVGPAGPIVDTLLEDRRVRKLSFTGSTEVGRSLMQKAARDLKRLSLELGGHAPVIVLDDAHLEQAVEGVLAAKFRNNGQSCIAANRLYVQQGIFEEFGQRLGQRMAKLRVGVGTQPGVEVGPLINREALQKVEAQVQDGLSRGGRVLTGGHRVAPDSAQGAFYAPTLLVGTGLDALVAHEETFGPLLAMWPFQSDEEAVRLANATPFGLAAYVYGRDIGRLTRMVEALEYGIIGVNDPIPTVAQAPFGGMKHSGYGREGGRQGLDEYLEWKYVSLRL